MKQKDLLKTYIKYNDCSAIEFDIFYELLQKENKNLKIDIYEPYQKFLKEKIYYSNDSKILLFAAMYMHEVNIELIFKKIMVNEFHSQKKCDIFVLIKFINLVDSKYTEIIFNELLTRKSISDCIVFYSTLNIDFSEEFEFEILCFGSGIDIVNYIKTNKNIDLNKFFKKINEHNIREKTILNFLYRKNEIEIDMIPFVTFACNKNSLDIMKKIIEDVNDEKSIKKMIDVIVDKNKNKHFHYDDCKLIEDLIQKNHGYRNNELCEIFMNYSCYINIEYFIKNNYEYIDLEYIENYYKNKNEENIFKSLMKKIEDKNKETEIINNDPNAEKINTIVDKLKETDDQEKLLEVLDIEKLLLIPNFINITIAKMNLEKIDTEIIFKKIKASLHEKIKNEQCDEKIFYEYSKIFMKSNNPEEMIKFLKEFYDFCPNFFEFEDAIINNFEIEASFKYLEAFPFADKYKFRYAFELYTNEFMVNEFDKLYPLDFNESYNYIK